MTKIDDSSIKELFKNAKKPKINVDKQAIFSKLQQRKNQALEEKTKSNKKKIWIRTGAALSFAMSCSLIIGLTLGLNQEKVKNYSNDYNYISNNSKSLAKQFYLIDNYTNDSNNESIKKAFDFNGILNDVKDIIKQEFNKILLVFANTFYSFEKMTGEVEKLNSPKEIDGKTYTCALKTRYLISSYTYYFNEDGDENGMLEVDKKYYEMNISSKNNVVSTTINDSDSVFEIIDNKKNNEGFNSFSLFNYENKNDYDKSDFNYEYNIDLPLSSQNDAKYYVKKTNKFEINYENIKSKFIGNIFVGLTFDFTFDNFLDEAFKNSCSIGVLGKDYEYDFGTNK